MLNVTSFGSSISLSHKLENVISKMISTYIERFNNNKKNTNIILLFTISVLLDTD